MAEAGVDGALNRFLFGSPYFLSSDRTMALIFIQPDFTMNDMDAYSRVIPALDDIVKQAAAELGWCWYRIR